MGIEEIKEIIVQSYSKTFDKQMAYIKVGLNGKEIEQLDMDEDFQNRLRLVLISERERIINNLRTFMDAENEKIAYQATKDFALLLYPEYFEPLKEERGPDPEDLENSEEEENRIRKEYGEVLQSSKEFTKSEKKDNDLCLQ